MSQNYHMSTGYLGNSKSHISNGVKDNVAHSWKYSISFFLNFPILLHTID